MSSARSCKVSGMDVTAGGSMQLLTQTLVESFNALADEVQNLSDRQTILEHKLRYAHEQVCPELRSFYFYLCVSYLRFLLSPALL